MARTATAAKTTKATKTTKAAAKKKPAPKKEEAFNPFENTRSSAAPAAKKSKSNMNQIACDDENVSQAIDRFAELNAEFKYIESELKAVKETIFHYAKPIHAQRMLDGEDKNFKIMSDNSTVSFIGMNKASSITEEELEELEEAHGKAVRDIFEKDESSIRFNQDFLDNPENKKKLLKALSLLGNDFVSQLFTPVKYKPVENIKDEAARICDSAEDLEDLYDGIRLVRYVRG